MVVAGRRGATLSNPSLADQGPAVSNLQDHHQQSPLLQQTGAESSLYCVVRSPRDPREWRLGKRMI